MTKTRFTFTEFAKKIDVSVSSIWRWHLHGVKGRKLKSKLIGGRRYVTQRQIDEFLNADTPPAESKLRQQAAKRKLDARQV